MRQLSREEKLMAAFKFNGLGEINGRNSDPCLIFSFRNQKLEILKNVDNRDQEKSCT